MRSQERVSESIVARRQELAARITAIHLEENPKWLERWGDLARQRCLEDADFHLQYLVHAIRFSAPSLFVAYARWARQVLERRSIPWEDLRRNLEIVRDEVTRDLDADDAALIRECIAGALESQPSESDSFLAATPREPLARAYLTALLKAERRGAIEIIDTAFRGGVSIRDLYLDVFQPVQREIGRLWQNNEISVAEEHYCTASTQALMAQFFPHILATPRVGRKVVVACVGNELHEIGTRMVADFFEMSGWDGIYLGANTPASALTELVRRERPDLVALGITMTYHLGTARGLIERLRSDDRCRNVKIIAGGYVFQHDADLWRALGIDGWAKDAAEAVAIGDHLVRGRTEQ